MPSCSESQLQYASALGQLTLPAGELAEKQEEIQAQSEELIEANTSLILLNMELAEKSEELEAQSEELRESNEIISKFERETGNKSNGKNTTTGAGL